MENTVAVAFATINEEIHEDAATGIQTLIESSLVDPSFFFINFSIRSTCRSHIRDLLLDRLMNNHSSRRESLATDIREVAWLWEVLASRIASAASNLGFGTNGFDIILVFTITHQRVSVASSSSESPLLQKLVFEGTIHGEELTKLKMETEPCSICLEDLSVSGAGVPTRMP